MIIQVEVPDGCVDGFGKEPLRIFSGITMVAYQYAGHPWMVKTSKCSQCGKCCENLKDDPIFPDGPCPKLVNDGDRRLCGLGINRIFSCSASDAVWFDKGCTVRWEPNG